jgi:hypothetical protein
MNGWTPYCIEKPDENALVRFWDELSGAQWTDYPRNLYVLFNVDYLWWKLTGCEKEGN